MSGPPGEGIVHAAVIRGMPARREVLEGTARNEKDHPRVVLSLVRGRAQPAATGILIALPEAMRCCHSAGPVMCALVPPASTATVTGMSTTSNS